jgi:hypothetical protein
MSRETDVESTDNEAEKSLGSGLRAFSYISLSRGHQSLQNSCLRKVQWSDICSAIACSHPSMG